MRSIRGSVRRLNHAHLFCHKLSITTYQRPFTIEARHHWSIVAEASTQTLTSSSSSSSSFIHAAAPLMLSYVRDVLLLSQYTVAECVPLCCTCVDKTLHRTATYLKPQTSLLLFCCYYYRSFAIIAFVVVAGIGGIVTYVVIVLLFILLIPLLSLGFRSLSSSNASPTH